ncbi:putative ribonuclease H protein, partial [Trifolium medium]|nr:putative ribonuclease H protein [Trifolium medium]
MAMLAKQGWNIMIKPESLVARMLKARYFPNTSFLDSHLGHNPSYSWRSIWSSRHILATGCRWRIGDGTKGNNWDAGKINAIFPSNVAKNIFAVPLFDIQGPDVLIWKGDMNGLYSVKSGYNMVMNMKQGTDDNNGGHDWFCVWNAHVPPK